MDSSGAELAHATIEVDEKYAEDAVRPSSNGDQRPRIDSIDKKHEHDVHSSSSSSQDDVEMEKLDSKIVKVGDLKEGEEAYAHLPDHEREIVKRQLEIPAIKVTFLTLYRYATRNDIIIIVISSICAIVGGAVMPLMTVGTMYTISQQNSAHRYCRSSLAN